MSEKSSTILDNPVDVTVNNRTLTTFTLGSGADLVIFESGGGAGGASWGLVVEALSALTDARIMIYNRAGYGTSWLAWDRRTLWDLASDLRGLIDTMSFRRLILVGHSWGGPIIRAVASSLPPSVDVSLVLVDGTDEGCPSYFSHMERAFWRNSWTLVPKALIGSLAAQKAKQLAGIPEPYRSQAVAESSSVKAAWGASYEIANIVPGLRELLADPERVRLDPRIALTIVSAQLPKGADMRKQLNAAHKERAAMQGERGKYVPAEKSGHGIYQSEPGLVAQEIAALLEKPAA